MYWQAQTTHWDYDRNHYLLYMTPPDATQANAWSEADASKGFVYPGWSGSVFEFV
jgi:hypothetical protein